MSKTRKSSIESLFYNNKFLIVFSVVVSIMLWASVKINYSADVTRYWASTGSLGRDIIMSEDELKNGAKLVNKLYNAGKFIWLFLENYTPRTCELLPMDKWIIAKFKCK